MVALELAEWTNLHRCGQRTIVATGDGGEETDEEGPIGRLPTNVRIWKEM